MTVALSEKQTALLNGAHFAHLVTLGKNGEPQVSPVWFEFDGTRLFVNSEKTRAKVRNVKRDPRVALSILDHANPYAYMEVRGKVVEVTEEGAFEQIDRLAHKYIGKEKYPFHQPGDVRVKMTIEIEKVLGLRT